jgi:hypothetical protein
VLQNPKIWGLITHCPTYHKHQKARIPFTLELVPDLLTPNYL